MLRGHQQRGGGHRIVQWLQRPLSEFGLRFRESRLQPFHERLLAELKGRGITEFWPSVYFGSEWFTPDRTIAISVPFYLAHPTLTRLAKASHIEVEGLSDASFMRLLRHECGHAFDHAYDLSKTREWKAVFGSPAARYAPDESTQKYNPREFVKNLAPGYAQVHPFEDFAETFAVWLHNRPAQIRRYVTSPVIREKLSYFDRLLTEVGQKKPLCTNRRPMTPVSRMHRSVFAYLQNPPVN